MHKGEIKHHVTRQYQPGPSPSMYLMSLENLEVRILLIFAARRCVEVEKSRLLFKQVENVDVNAGKYNTHFVDISARFGVFISNFH